MIDELITKNFSGFKIDIRLLKKITLFYLKKVLGESNFSLGIFIVKPEKIEEINKKFLQHEGPTDVISFNYSDIKEVQIEAEEKVKPSLYGEIYVCPEVALEHSKKFRTPPGEEILRYIIHGILHIKGFNDLNPQERKQMRKAENNALKKIRSAFNINGLVETRSVHNRH